MAQQTAVQWLLSELQIRLLKIKSEPDGIVRETMIYNFLIDTEQAKQMEKEQIIDAYNKGQLNGIDYRDGSSSLHDEQDYYNGTYGKE